jgi:hypothetical protein
MGQNQNLFCSPKEINMLTLDSRRLQHTSFRKVLVVVLLRNFPSESRERVQMSFSSNLEKTAVANHSYF